MRDAGVLPRGGRAEAAAVFLHQAQARGGAGSEQPSWKDCIREACQAEVDGRENATEGMPALPLQPFVTALSASVCKNHCM